MQRVPLCIPRAIGGKEKDRRREREGGREKVMDASVIWKLVAGMFRILEVYRGTSSTPSLLMLISGSLNYIGVDICAK